MIKAEELMLGDWVMSIHPAVPRPIKVTEIGGNDIGYKNGILHISFIEPIPITPEILEENGFELKADGWLWSNEGLEDQNYIFIQFRKGCEGVRNCEINFIHRAQFTFKQMYFVHELQHALKLCGINKNIEL